MILCQWSSVFGSTTLGNSALNFLATGLDHWSGGETWIIDGLKCFVTWHIAKGNDCLPQG